jgi:hypothetical protein
MKPRAPITVWLPGLALRARHRFAPQISMCQGHTFDLASLPDGAGITGFQADDHETGH